MLGIMGYEKDTKKCNTWFPLLRSLSFNGREIEIKTQDDIGRDVTNVNSVK